MKGNGYIIAGQSIFAWFCGEMRRRESSLSDLTLRVFPTCISFISPYLTFLTTQTIVQTTSGRPRRSTSKKGLFGGLLGGFGNGGNVFQAKRGGGAKRVATSADIMRHRQGAIKVEPKVFFANERTFLAWLHCAVLLAGASIAIMSFAETDLAGQLYGVILLPVSIAFMTYAMSQCESECQLVWFAYLYEKGTYLFCFLTVLYALLSFLACRCAEIVHDSTTGSWTVRGHHRPHGAGHCPHAFHPCSILDQTLRCHALRA